MSDINIGALSEAINDKMDRDLNNRSTDSGLRKLVESYVNGTSWYKIFDEIQSDGTVKQWCEQGGIFSGTFANGYSFTLLKAYANTDYLVLAKAINTSNAQTSYGVLTYTTTSFSGEAFRGTSAAQVISKLYWRAEGYIS